MIQHRKYYARRSPRIIAIAGLILVIGSQAYADVVGRLHFSVKNASDEKALEGAKITLKDSAGSIAPVMLKTDAAGNVTTEPLPARVWKLTVEAQDFQVENRDVSVVADTTTEVEVLLEPLKETVIKITGRKQLLRVGDSSSTIHRNRDFIKSYPLNSGNPQSLGQLLKSTPGLVQDSVNQAHPRGEHSSTSLYIDGFALPGVLQGRAGPILSPDVIQNLDVLTGGYAPEYGGELAAVLNVNLRAGTITPNRDLLLQGGGYRTLFGNLSFSGQGGQRIGSPAEEAPQARRFGYFLNFNARTTSNALEPPQPDRQSAHNNGQSETYFGHFGYKLGSQDELTFTANSSPANTEIANRTGLQDNFADVGQGYGYSGHLSRADALANGISSQEVSGQDIYQLDRNEFGSLSLRHTFNDRVTGMLSLGVVHAGLEILNRSPLINQGNLPHDSSIEFNPTIKRNSHNGQVQLSLTASESQHTFKLGALNDDQLSNESYTLIPGSQLAVNALAAVDLRLLGAGSLQFDGNGDPILDELGNQVYSLDPGAVAPTVAVRHKGFYRALYAQDTWRASERLTLNYGARLDWYKADVTLGGVTDSIESKKVSPRVNLAYKLDPSMVGRLSFNRMFTQPPLSQGATLGLAIPPQTGDLYEASVERQIGTNQTAKFAVYHKDWKNFADTGLLVPGTQLGVYTTFSHPHVQVTGYEFSYDLFPRNAEGWGSYFTWSHSINKLLAPEEGFTDHDQLNTLGFGLNYKWANDTSAGISLYYGSGVASSVVRDGGPRTSRTIVNLRLASSPSLFGHNGLEGTGGLELTIENLFDDRNVINFQSAFSGTRFQQGRRVQLAATFKF